MADHEGFQPVVLQKGHYGQHLLHFMIGRVICYNGRIIYLTGITLIHYFQEHLHLLPFSKSLLTLYLIKGVFLVGVKNINNGFDSTDDKMGVKGKIMMAVLVNNFLSFVDLEGVQSINSFVDGFTQTLVKV